jgi:hypothetical protein
VGSLTRVTLHFTSPKPQHTKVAWCGRVIINAVLVLPRKPVLVLPRKPVELSLHFGTTTKNTVQTG